MQKMIPMEKAKAQTIPQDKARRQTDKRLDKIEGDIGRIYRDDPAIVSIQKEYAEFMASVQERVEGSYRAYIDAEDEDAKEEAKKAYMDEVRHYTVESAEYRKLAKKVVTVLAQVNQKAVDVVNVEMPSIYCINYNQVAEDCKKVGIRVDGEK